MTFIRLSPKEEVAFVTCNKELYAVDMSKKKKQQAAGAAVQSCIFPEAIVSLGVSADAEGSIAVAMSDKSFVSNLNYPRDFAAAGAGEECVRPVSTFKTAKKITCIIGATIPADSGPGSGSEGVRHAFVASDRVGEIVGLGTNKEPAAQTSVNLGGHPTSVLTSVTQSACGHYLVSTDRNEKIRVAHFPQMLKVGTFCMGHTAAVLATCSLPSVSAELLCSVGWDNRMCLWAFKQGSLLSSVDVVANSGANADAIADANTFTGKGLPWKVVASPLAGVVAAAAKDSPLVLLATVVKDTSSGEYSFGAEVRVDCGAVPLDVVFAADGSLVVATADQVLQLKVFSVSVAAGGGSVTACMATGARVPSGLTAFNALATKKKLEPDTSTDTEGGADNDGLTRKTIGHRWSAEDLATRISTKRAANKEKYLAFKARQGPDARGDATRKRKAEHGDETKKVEEEA